MNETEKGYLYDVSWDDGQDWVYIDTGDDEPVYLSFSDLREMLDILGGE